MSSYRAALCDDEAADRAQIAGLCRDIFTAWGMDAEVIPFASADELRRAPDAALFDLYLLDIRMAGTSGLELARQFYSRGIRDRIIFITGDPEFALEGYDVEPLHYLLKPVGRDRLEAALRRAVERWEQQTALFRWGGKTAALPLREIRCLESRDHGVVVCLGERERTFPLSLAEAERLVPARMFRRCHKSYLVNMDWVDHLTRSGVFLRDGRCLPVSRSCYAGFQTALVRYLNHPGI